MFLFDIPFLTKNNKIVKTLVAEDHIVFARKNPKIQQGGFDTFAIKSQDFLAYLATALIISPTESIIGACSDETTALTTGLAKLTFRIPYNFTLSSIKASLTTTSSSGNVVVNVKKNGTTILSTLITIEAGDTTSLAATTQPVISVASFTNDDVVTIDIDSAGTGATGLKVTLIGKQ